MSLKLFACFFNDPVGTGASGSFKVTKTYKEELKKLEKKKEKEASKKEKQKNETESTKDTGKSSKKKESSTKKQSETKSKRKVKDAPSAEEMTSPVKKKAAKKTTKQTGDIGEEKKVTKKPPIARGKQMTLYLPEQNIDSCDVAPRLSLELSGLYHIKTLRYITVRQNNSTILRRSSVDLLIPIN